MDTGTTPPLRLFFNGLGPSGRPLRPPVDLDDLVRSAPRGERFQVRGPRPGLDPDDLTQVGWGVVFAPDTPAEVRAALAPLLDWRREQVTAGGRCFWRELTALPDERATDFLVRHRAPFGLVDPERLPYHLLLVGDPVSLSYGFQVELDAQHAVGRICFDRPADYAAYARSVVAVESGQATRPRRAELFGTRHPGDAITDSCLRNLVRPLAGYLQERHPDWSVDESVEAAATRHRLVQLLGGEKTPALLLTAGHGLGLPSGDPLQLEHQGALVCQDWPEPGSASREVLETHYLRAGDLGDDADLLGLVAFLFACFSAGTSRVNPLALRLGLQPLEAAPRDLVARLPQRLLAHPAGGALAVIGHLDQALEFSFFWKGAGGQIATFEDAVSLLLAGHRVGTAMEAFGQRYAALAVHLAGVLEEVLGPGGAGEAERTALWLAHCDARNYAVFGDPAVRLAAEAGPRQERQS